MPHTARMLPQKKARPGVMAGTTLRQGGVGYGRRIKHGRGAWRGPPPRGKAGRGMPGRQVGLRPAMGPGGPHSERGVSGQD